MAADSDVRPLFGRRPSTTGSAIMQNQSLATIPPSIPGRAGSRARLATVRPVAIITAKHTLAATTQLSTAPTTNEASPSKYCMSPSLHSPQTAGHPRFTVANRNGKNREIAKIEEPGKIGDFYDFGSILGRGGFGTVSEILHARTFQPFAGKALDKASFDDDGPGCEESFRDVQEMLLNSNCTNVVRILHIFEDESNYYIVMDVCQGGTLRRAVKDGSAFASDISRHKVCEGEPKPQRLQTRMLEDVFTQTANGIGYLHKLRLVHRDIKPDNIMLMTAAGNKEDLASCPRVRVCIVDFDMCSLMDDDDEVKCRHLEGTPGYIAPEVLECGRYTVVSDLFAFGCFAYYLLHYEEPCPQMSGINAPMSQMLEAMDRWLEDARCLCDKAQARDGLTTSIPLSDAPPLRHARLTSRINSIGSALTGGASPSSSGRASETIPGNRSPGLPPVLSKYGSAANLMRPATSAANGCESGQGGEPKGVGSLASAGALICRIPSKGIDDRTSSKGSCEISQATPGMSDDNEVAFPGTAPARFWKLAAWCLERDPARRPSSVQAMLKSGILSAGSEESECGGQSPGCSPQSTTGTRKAPPGQASPTSCPVFPQRAPGGMESPSAALAQKERSERRPKTVGTRTSIGDLLKLK